MIKLMITNLFKRLDRLEDRHEDLEEGICSDMEHVIEAMQALEASQEALGASMETVQVQIADLKAELKTLQDIAERIGKRQLDLNLIQDWRP